jgi:fructokinase
VLGIGELLWDLLPAGPRLGGAPFNVTAHMRRLGLDSAFLTAVGDDALGRDALDSMRSLGVRTDLVQIVRDAPTGTAAVELDDDGRPRFEIGSPAAYEQIRCDAAALEVVAALTPAAIVFGTLAQRFAPVRAATRAILAAHPDAMRVYDVNLREGCWTAPLVKELLAEATILKLSDAEVPVLARMLDLPSETPGSFGRAIGRLYDLDVVCVTEGGSGSTAWTRDGVVWIAGISVDVVDTIGAGDAFTAAFVATLLKGEPAAEALRLANALGALVASREGAIPAWNLSELVALL